MTLSDAELADEIIARLNDLIEDPEVREDVHELMEARQPCSEASACHPTIQVLSDQSAAHNPLLGFLGLLNGLVGVMPAGPRAGWGYITAIYGDDGTLVGFQRTHNAV